MNKTKRSRLTDIENKLVVISGEREVGGEVRGVGDFFFKKVIMELYKIVCVKLLKAANTIEFKQSLSFNKKCKSKL